MDTSCGFICVFAMLINQVSSQETVTAVIGGSVLLPCSSTEGHKPQDINVFWRHNGSELVYDRVNGENSLELQGPRYKNRTECFPQEYKRGNFSIKINNLTHTDAGEYMCYITLSSEFQTVLLIINESTAGKGTESTEQEKQGETELNSVETSSPWLWVGIASAVVIVIVIVIVIAFIVAWWKRKNSGSHRADRHDMGAEAHEDEHMNN